MLLKSSQAPSSSERCNLGTPVVHQESKTYHKCQKANQSGIFDNFLAGESFFQHKEHKLLDDDANSQLGGKGVQLQVSLFR
jgi:hypothetical protein